MGAFNLDEKKIKAMVEGMSKQLGLDPDMVKSKLGGKDGALNNLEQFDVKKIDELLNDPEIMDKLKKNKMAMELISKYKR